MGQQSRVVIIGLGNVGLPLVAMLPRELPLVCIDINPAIAERIRQQRGDSAVTVTGDATSRLVLEEAGVDSADTVVICTTSERVNVEVARVVAEHFRVQRMIALGITQQGIEELSGYGAEVESIFAVSAIGIRNRLEMKAKAVHGIGIGKNEILEVEIHPNSRLVNKRLASLRPQHWHIGIIYRDGNIIIPRGDTLFKARDKVIILGDPQALRTMADIMTFRFQEFPLEYGDTLFVFLQGGEDASVLDETCFLRGTFPFDQSVVIHPPGAAPTAALLRDKMVELHGRAPYLEESSLPPAATVEQLIRQRAGRPGMVVLSRPRMATGIRTFLSERVEKSMLLGLCRSAGCPILLARGTFPYHRIAIPCLDADSLPHALETAQEIATSLSWEITALFPELSRYIAVEADLADEQRMRKTVADLGLVYRRPIGTKEVSGNPILGLAAACADHQLLAVNIGSWRVSGLFSGIFRPDVCWHLVRRSPISVLLIPPTESSI